MQSYCTTISSSLCINMFMFIVVVIMLLSSSTLSSLSPLSTLSSLSPLSPLSSSSSSSPLSTFPPKLLPGRVSSALDGFQKLANPPTFYFFFFFPFCRSIKCRVWLAASQLLFRYDELILSFPFLSLPPPPLPPIRSLPDKKSFSFLGFRRLKNDFWWQPLQDPAPKNILFPKQCTYRHL